MVDGDDVLWLRVMMHGVGCLLMMLNMMVMMDDDDAWLMTMMVDA